MEKQWEDLTEEEREGLYDPESTHLLQRGAFQ